MSRRLVLAVLCAAFARLAVSAGPAAALPPTCDPQQSSCNPEPIERTETANRKLTVTAAIGTVTSNPAGINCTASTCSTTKQVSRTCLEFDCNDWPAATGYTLTASGGPSGYSPSWSACAGNGTCTVFLGDEGTGARLQDGDDDVGRHHRAEHDVRAARQGRPEQLQRHRGRLGQLGRDRRLRLDRRLRRPGRHGLRALALGPLERHALRVGALARRRGQLVGHRHQERRRRQDRLGLPVGAPRHHQRRHRAADVHQGRGRRQDGVRDRRRRLRRLRQRLVRHQRRHRRRHAQLQGPRHRRRRQRRRDRRGQHDDRPHAARARLHGRPGRGPAGRHEQRLDHVLARRGAAEHRQVQARRRRVERLHRRHARSSSSASPTARTSSRSRRSTRRATPARSAAPSA